METEDPAAIYSHLNVITPPDPIPYMHDSSACSTDKSFLSNVDLVQGHHQVPVHPQDVTKAAVITPFSHFKISWMLFGWKNAAELSSS